MTDEQPLSESLNEIANTLADLSPDKMKSVVQEAHRTRARISGTRGGRGIEEAERRFGKSRGSR